MSTIGYWDGQHTAGTVFTFGLRGDYRYRITAVSECDGYGCPVGGGCVAELELTNVDFPRLGFDAVHVGADRDASTLGKAVV